MNMLAFLKLIAGGKTGFDPESSSVNDLSSFQVIAKTAEEAYNHGYIEYFKLHRESYSSHRFIDCVLASGLTEEGQEFLDQHQR